MVALLCQRGAILEAPNHEGYTALHWATREGYDIVAIILADAGANVDMHDIFEFTALNIAALRVHDKVVKMLLDSGANTEMRCDSLFTPLLMAANNVRIKAVKMLLDFNADISARSKNGNTALRIVSRSGISYSREIAAAIRRAAGGWARVRGLVLFLHSGGYAAADWSARRIGRQQGRRASNTTIAIHHLWRGASTIHS